MLRFLRRTAFCAPPVCHSLAQSVRAGWESKGDSGLKGRDGWGGTCGPALALSQTFSSQLPPPQKTQPLRAGLRNAGPSARERCASGRDLGNFLSNAYRPSFRGVGAAAIKPFPTHSEHRGASKPSQCNDAVMPSSVDKPAKLNAPLWIIFFWIKPLP